MKRYIPLLVVILLFVLAVPVYAQDNDPLKNELINLINQLGAVGVTLITGFTATLASALTNWVRHLRWFSEEDKSKIVGLGADLVNVLSSLIVTLLTIGIAQLVGLVQGLSTQEILQAVFALTAMTSGGSSVVVHKLNKALAK